MKSFFICLFFTSALFVSNAQIVKPDGFINNGGTASFSSVSMVSSIGEPVIGLFKDGWNHCLQGFVYKVVPFDFATNIERPLALTSIAVSVYPNPAPDYLYVDCDGDNVHQLAYSIYAENGRLIKKGLLTGKLTKISLEHLIPAPYVLIIQNPSTHIIYNRSKFIKI